MFNTQISRRRSGSSILIRQNQEIPTIWMYDCAPSWNYVSPTPELQQKGLTPKALRTILNYINERSETDFRNKYDISFTCVAFLAPIGVIIGIIISLSTFFSTMYSSFRPGNPSNGFIIGITICAVCTCLSIVLCWMVKNFHSNAYQSAMDNIKQYVEINLNKRYKKSNGIRWSIIFQQTISTRFGGDDTHIDTHTWYNIRVTSLQNNINQQPQIVIVVPQQIHQQQQQIIQNDDVVEIQAFVPKKYSEGDNISYQ